MREAAIKPEEGNTGRSQWAFSFDGTACSGCKACQVACKDYNGLEPGRLWRRVYEVTGGEWEKAGEAWVSSVFAYNLSLACNHCREPICLEVCPAGAIWKREDGIVLIEASKCLGCGYCSWACPYGAPQYDPLSGGMTKCDFCAGRLDAGLAPICVAACPLRVLDYGKQSEPERQNGSSSAFPLPETELTQPALALTTHKDALGADSKTAQVTNREETEPDLGKHTLKGRVKSLSLVVFTLLAPMAAGGAVFISVLRRLPGFGPAQDLALDRLLWGVAGLAGLSMLVALLHLGSPLRSWRALANWRASWLSREILCLLLFTGLALGLAWLEWQGISQRALREGLGWVMGLSGLGLVYCMARIYMLRTVTAWNRSFTLLAFFTTAFLLGGLAVGAALAVYPAGPGAGLAWEEWRWSALGLTSRAGIFLVAVDAVLMIAWANPRQPRWLRARGMLAGAVIAALVGIVTPSNITLAQAALTALGFGLAHQVLSRVAFYEMRGQGLVEG